jgi:hypothetical protein
MGRLGSACSRTPARICLMLACLAAPLFATSSAAGETLVFDPVQATQRALVFAPSGLDPDSVTSARALHRSAGQRSARSVPAHRVRDAVRSGSSVRVNRPAGSDKGGKLRVRGRKPAHADPSADTTPPDTAITAGPSGTISSTSAGLSFSATESRSGYECNLDGAAWSSCSNPKAYGGLSEGPHEFAVRAIDAAGNVDPTPATRTFAVQAAVADTTPPETTIASGPSGTISSASTSLSFSSSESPSSFECRLDAGSWAACSSPKAYSSLANGAHTFEVRATDAAENTDQTPASRAFTIQVSSADGCTWGTFSANSMPGACWRPYSDSSPFNRGLGGAPRLASNSSSMVHALTGFGQPQNIVGGFADTADDWDHPLYYSQPSDPLYTVHCTQSWGTCEVEGMQIRIPNAARPAAGGDGSMGVIDQASGWEYDFWRVQSKPSGGGTISVSWGGRTQIGTATADGLGSNATAAHFGTAAGVIRPEELATGHIDHALFMVVYCTNGTYVWPAEGPGVGRSCSSVERSNTNAPAMGQHFYLNMTDAQIAALSVPQWKQTILTALAHYGAFVGDTGGSSWRFKVESGTSYTSFGKADPWVQLGQSLGLPQYKGDYVFDVKSGVDWSKLAVADPCVARGTC